VAVITFAVATAIQWAALIIGGWELALWTLPAFITLTTWSGLRCIATCGWIRIAHTRSVPIAKVGAKLSSVYGTIFATEARIAFTCIDIVRICNADTVTRAKR